jgi:hypothetical protein
MPWRAHGLPGAAQKNVRINNMLRKTIEVGLHLAQCALPYKQNEKP